MAALVKIPFLVLFSVSLFVSCPLRVSRMLSIHSSVRRKKNRTGSWRREQWGACSVGHASLSLSLSPSFLSPSLYLSLFRFVSLSVVFLSPPPSIPPILPHTHTHTFPMITQLTPDTLYADSQTKSMMYRMYSIHTYKPHVTDKQMFTESRGKQCHATNVVIQQGSHMCNDDST